MGSTISLPAAFSRRYALLAGIILAAIWLWVAFDRPYVFPNHEAWSLYSNTVLTPAPIGLTDIFDFPPVDSESIKSICSDTQWNSSVIFTCENSVGGIGNIRNSILNCVRYTISAGGGMVLPKIVVRNSKDISKIRTGERTNMDYMFDQHHFVESLRISCPQLKLYNNVDDIPNGKKAHDLISLLPESLVPDIPKTGLAKPEDWRGTFYEWLEQYRLDETDGPMIIELGRSYLQYPIYTDGEGFALSFGGILKFREDVRILATTVLQNMAEQYSLVVEDLTEPVFKNSFFGAHLRTEKDAQEGWPAPDWIWSRYETQSKSYLEQASISNTSLIYVASGDLAEVAKFAEEARAINIQVTTKSSLLQENLMELETLAWDQQGMVDYLVLLKASDFAGVGHSSFAWNIALKRHVFAENKNHLNGPQMLSDELSQIYGMPWGYPEYASCLWP